MPKNNKDFIEKQVDGFFDYISKLDNTNQQNNCINESIFLDIISILLIETGQECDTFCINNLMEIYDDCMERLSCDGHEFIKDRLVKFMNERDAKDLDPEG